MNEQINLAVQVLPTVPEGIKMYDVVDQAIKAIAESGLKYRVCPFETVIEGPYDQVMAVVKEAQEACYRAGAVKCITNLKIQTAADAPVAIEDKIGKYDDLGWT